MIKTVTRWLDERCNRRQLAKLSLSSQPKRLQIRGRLFVVVYGAQKPCITLGDRILINSGFTANPVSGDKTCFILMRSEARIEIGSRTKMSNVTLASAASITIGEDVMLGASARIFDHDFHSIHLEHRLAGNVGIVCRPVRIEDGAFIGAGATILKGVTVGSRAVVGAGAVVTRSIPPGEIWAGNPARRIGAVSALSTASPAKFID